MVKAIQTTLLEAPTLMAVKSIGIFVLAEEAEFSRLVGGAGELAITLSDPELHGIVNGGHTFLTIREAIEGATEEEEPALRQAYVRLHVYQGVDAQLIPEMADGLNRSKQVDDPSLLNLAKLFDDIKDVMKGEPGEAEISYHQGGDGTVYITEVLAALELFNCERFTDTEHPNRLFSSNKLPVKYFEEDYEAKPSPLKLLVPKLPDILRLSDLICKKTPVAAKKLPFAFGLSNANKEKGKSSTRVVPLPFIGETMEHRVYKGWLLPMLAAFRANVDWDLRRGKFAWKMPPERVLDGVIDDMVRICVRVHVDNKSRPEFVGKIESAYAQCYDKVVIHLAKKGKLN